MLFHSYSTFLCHRSEILVAANIVAVVEYYIRKYVRMLSMSFSLVAIDTERYILIQSI